MRKIYKTPLASCRKINNTRFICTSPIGGGDDGNGRPAEAKPVGESIFNNGLFNEDTEE